MRFAESERVAVLAAAAERVEEQTKTHGDPEDCFKQIAALWTAYNGTSYAPQDVVAMLILLKIAQNSHTPGNVDNWIDIAGYAACGAEVST